MASDRWGPAGPPEEAYSRVTNPERFVRLHDIASDVAEDLRARFAVELASGYGVDDDLVSGPLQVRLTLARPTLRLTPRDADQASIVIAFTAFPGLRVRFGSWYKCSFPDCGCDACDETLEDQSERLRALVADVVEGRFRESIRLWADGNAWLEWEFWKVGGWSLSREAVDLDRAQQLLAQRGTDTVRFRAWSIR